MEKLPQSRSEELGSIGVAVLRKGRASVRQASKLLGSDISTVENLILGGKLRAYKVKDRWKIPVYALIEAGAVLPNPMLIEGAKGLKPIDSNDDSNPQDIEVYYE